MPKSAKNLAEQNTTAHKQCGGYSCDTAIPQMDADCDIAGIDIIERNLPKSLLEILLKDMSTGRNILWACDGYAQYGNAYKSGCEITYKAIAGKKNTMLIQPRILKAKCYQKERTRTHAEVFTPSWICNEMNNYCGSLAESLF